MTLRLCSLFVVFLLAGCAGGRPLHAPFDPAVRVKDPEFRQAMGNIIGPPFVSGNRVTTLNNGHEIFAAMLSAIRSARRTITFETFVFEKGEVPQAFAEALAERARAGVKVHAIIDAHGGKKSRTYRKMLREAGVELEIYHPILWLDPRRYNNRTHRKLLVIDGKIGFIGGVGIADEWDGNADTPEHWRDLHYKIDGPAVAHLQAAFNDNWMKTHYAVLYGPGYYPPLPAAGNVAASVFFASPRHGSFYVPVMYHLAIASARRTLRIANAYFVPDAETEEALVAAARRRVKVELILPGRHIDQKSVRRASRKRWRKLLEAGIAIYEYQPTMIHSKLLIADDLFVSVGSSNFDNRSLRINDEANLNVLHAEFAAEQTRFFEKDKRDSVRVTLENLKQESLTEKPLQTLEAPLDQQL